MEPRSSFAGRAILAIILMVGFYLLALGLAGGLAAIPLLELKYAKRIHPKLLIACAIGAIAILWAVFPRPDRFEAPGPRLSRKRHPKLFAVLDGIARDLGEEMPAEVYLVAQMNAFVTSRGGMMGFGSRRVMGLGLPLLQVLSVDELRGVVAHEFGHFRGGDVALGPWTYKTRAAIGRTLEALDSGPIQWIFLGYGKLFLLITHAMSRQQELDADALAVKLVGARAFGQGLKKTHGTDPAFQAFLQHEYLPVLASGFRPPLAQGFGRFLKAKVISTAVNEGVRAEIREGQGSLYDTHPPLKDRLKAIEDLPQGTAKAKDPSSITLLEEVETVESELLAFVFGDKARELEPIERSETLEKVTIPAWREGLAEEKEALEGLTAASVPEVAATIHRVARGLKDEMGQPLPKEEAREAGVTIVASALTLALVDEGFTLSGDPGEPVVAEREGLRLEPRTLLRELCDAKLTADQWKRKWRDTGVMDVELATVVKKAKEEKPDKAPGRTTRRRRRPGGTES